MTEKKRRITKHPILPEQTDSEKVTIYYNGSPISAIKGEPIAATLMSVGIRVFRKTVKQHETRGLFCAIGRCTDCMMVVDGTPNTRTCITSVKDGMRVESQNGYGINDKVNQ